MLVTLLIKFRNKDCKTTELGLLLQVLAVRIVTFVETLGATLKARGKFDSSRSEVYKFVAWRSREDRLGRSNLDLPKYIYRDGVRTVA